MFLDHGKKITYGPNLQPKRLKGRHAHGKVKIILPWQTDSVSKPMFLNMCGCASPKKTTFFVPRHKRY